MTREKRDVRRRRSVDCNPCQSTGEYRVHPITQTEVKIDKFEIIVKFSKQEIHINMMLRAVADPGFLTGATNSKPIILKNSLPKTAWE